jgi:predicted nucleic acid-binding protein
MIIVSDTTPLITLLKIHHLDILGELFHEILIPEAVYVELTTNERFMDEAIEIMKCPFIQKVEVADQKSVRIFRKTTGLDAGESEAIVLAEDIKADLLLMDEAKGRLVAQQMDLKIMGTMGILLYAYEEKMITKEDVIASLQIIRETGRFISDRLIKELMKKINNR